MDKVGGFQSGFSARKIKREHIRWPQYLICQHNCQEIVQLISHISGEVEFELCEIEAKRMVHVLLEAIE